MEHKPSFSGKLREVTRQFKRELAVYHFVLADPRTPRPAKIFLGMALAYLLLPFDLIPDFIPALGQLDDVLIVPGLVLIALRMIPKEIIEEYRKQIGEQA